MTTRGIVAALLIALATPLVAGAQSPPKLFRVVELNPIPPRAQDGTPSTSILQEALRDLGYVQGQNILLEERFASGSEDRLREYAAEAVGSHADIIVAVSSSAVRAARNATKTIPIVGMDLESDPVAAGIVASLARPGGNLTGVFLDLPELNGKRLELLKEVIPGITRVAILWDPTMDPAPLRKAETAARSLGLSLQTVEARGPSDFANAFGAAVKGRNNALMVIQSPVFDVNPAPIVDLSVKHRLPTTSIFSHFTKAGLLMSYGPNLADLFRQAATYVDRMLKGARVEDLPVQRPTRFELVINLKTAKALGLTIPPSLLLRADEVIK